MDEKFRRLSELGAGDFEHLEGPLIEHLKGTRNLLNEWSASAILKDAGLFHAAYGTDGFDENLVSVTQRKRISKIIGRQAEQLVYNYCACDRHYFFAQLGGSKPPKFRNRFTDEVHQLSLDELLQLCELTAANETEIAIDNLKFVADHGEELNNLFVKMAPYLSEAARSKTSQVFGGNSALLFP